MCPNHYQGDRIGTMPLTLPQWGQPGYLFNNMIDVECGEGDTAAWFSECFREIIGIDSRDECVIRATDQNDLTNATFYNGRPDDLPATAESVQLVTLMHYNPAIDLPTFYAECRRVLVPKGLEQLDFGGTSNDSFLQARD